MKSPVTGMELRWRLAGDTAWVVQRYPPSTTIQVPDAVRGGNYTIEVRNLGVMGMDSAWVTVNVTVPTTNREGSAALPVNAFGNQSSVWDVDTSVAFSATDSQATITVSAGTLVSGDITIPYGSSSAVVSGAPETTKTVYLYYDDPHLEGGSRTLGVTESYVESTAGAGRLAITSLKITFPAVGAPPSTGGGGIGGGGGGGGARNPETTVPV